MEMTMNQMHIDIQKCDLGGEGKSNEFYEKWPLRHSRNWVKELGP
jgi:hypothetical protein